MLFPVSIDSAPSQALFSRPACRLAHAAQDEGKHLIDKLGAFRGAGALLRPAQIPVDDAEYVEGGHADVALGEQIGRASCRERVCQYVSNPVVAGPLKKKK